MQTRIPYRLAASVCLTSLFWVTLCLPTFGHGTPILVDVNDTRSLIVGNGELDPRGYAARVYADPIEDSVFLPAPGRRQITTFPGFLIRGMEVDSGLNLEVVGIPVRNARGVDTRYLWYWDPATRAVAPLPEEQALTVFSNTSRTSTVIEPQGTAPGRITVALPAGDDLGEHRHFLTYLLRDAIPSPVEEQPAALGVYGVFARLHSPNYATSETFFLGLNHGLDATSFRDGALAVNRAALLPGDANRDFRVDINDFVALRSHFGQTPQTWDDGDFSHDERVDLQDFIILRNHFGQTHVTVVPEPQTLTWLLIAMGTVAFSLRSASLREQC